MTIFLMYLIALLNLYNCLDDGPNVCRTIQEGKNYCCSDYENIQGQCVACSIGYVSMNGSRCTPCISNYYGLRCLSKCDCSGLLRCHHIYGCINNSLSHSTVKSVDKNSDNTEIYNLHMLAHEVIVYFIPVTGMLVILGVCCLAYRRRRVVGRRSSENYNVRHSFDQSVDENFLDDILTLQPTSMFAYGVTQDIAHDESKEYRVFLDTQRTDTVTPITNLNEQLDDTTEHQYPSLETFKE